MTVEPITPGAAISYAADISDILRMSLRHEADVLSALEELLSQGPAGVDQAVALIRDARDAVTITAAEWLPGEDLSAYLDGTPIFIDQPVAPGRSWRQYREHAPHLLRESEEEGHHHDED